MYLSFNVIRQIIKPWSLALLTLRPAVDEHNGSFPQEQPILTLSIRLYPYTPVAYRQFIPWVLTALAGYKVFLEPS